VRVQIVYLFLSKLSVSSSIFFDWGLSREICRLSAFIRCEAVFILGLLKVHISNASLLIERACWAGY